MKTNNIDFNILRETVSQTDRFDGTHDNIAETLSKIIQSEEEGLTIGLEGTWGSGKSTVVSLFEEKVKDKNIKVVKFDSWAHEKDPLRRIFLESLINEITEDDEENKKQFSDIKNKITKRIKKVTVKTKQYTTTLGTLLALSAFIVPVGLVIMPDISTVCLSFRLPIHYLFILALFFVSSPLLIIAGNFFYLWFNKKKKVCDRNNWIFLEKGSSQNVKQELSEENERSSIEFEKYFDEILKIYFENNLEGKIVLVIDNLDRINPQDTLYLLSTLQTFLQQRNDINKKPWFKKLWIIIPYDQEGLSSVWKNNKNSVNKEDNDEIENKIAKSFFDKNFQIKLEVPKPILSNWIEYTKTMIDEAINEEEKKTKEDILEILRFTRKDINDIPTPREIKNYINQVLLLTLHTDGMDIPIKSIAYYVILRQLQSLTKDDISKKLLDNKIPDNKTVYVLPETCRKDIAGLIFGVTPEKGNQLLLEPEIGKMLENRDSTELRKIYEEQRNDFWSVFDFHIDQKFDISIDSIFNYSKAIVDTFGIEKKKYNSFLKRVKKNFEYKIGDLKFPKDNSDAHLAFLKIFVSDVQIAVTFYEQFVLTLNNEIKKQENITIETIKIIQSVVELYKNPEKKTIEVTFTGFSKWVEFNNQLNLELWKYFKPWQKIFENITLLIKPNNIFHPILASLKYIEKSNEEKDWMSILNSIQEHINHNTGNFANHSDEVFEILTFLAFTSESSHSKISQIIKSSQFGNLLHHRRKQSNNLLYASIVFAYLINEDIQTMNIPSNGLNLIKKFWKTKDNNIAKQVLDFAKEHNDYRFIWNLLKNKQNLLGKDIINIASGREQNNALFKISDFIETAKLVVKYDKLEKSAIFKKLTEQNDNIAELILDKKEEIDIIEDSELLYHTICYINDEKLNQYISSRLSKITKEEWNNAFEDDTYLTYLAIQLKTNMKNFKLGLDYHDSFLEYSKKVENVSKKQENYWNELIEIQSKRYFTQYKDKITFFLINSFNNVSELFIKLNLNFFDADKILKTKDVFESIVEQLLEKKSYDKLKKIIEMFNNIDFSDCKFDSDKVNIINDRIKEIKEIEDIEETLNRILDIFGISINK